MWENGRPKTRYGYTDFGPIQIAVLPENLILTDRADGTLWHLSYSLTYPFPDNLGLISINSVLPLQNQRIHAAYEEPYFMFSQGRVQLMVRSGQLGVDTEIIPEATRDQYRIIARYQLNPDMREVILSTTEPGWYAWQQVIS